MLDKITVYDMFKLMDSNTSATEKFKIYLKIRDVNTFLVDVEDLFETYFHTYNLEEIDEILSKSNLNIMEEE